MPIPPGSSELPVPSRDTKNGQHRPVRQQRGPAPLFPTLQDPEKRPKPRVAVVEAPPCPHTDEATYDKNGTDIKSECKQAAMLRLRLRVAQAAHRLLCDMPREVEQWRKQKANEEGTRNERDLVNEQRRRQPVGLDKGRGNIPDLREGVGRMKTSEECETYSRDGEIK